MAAGEEVVTCSDDVHSTYLNYSMNLVDCCDGSTGTEKANQPDIDRDRDHHEAIKVSSRGRTDIGRYQGLVIDQLSRYRI